MTCYWKDKEITQNILKLIAAEYCGEHPVILNRALRFYKKFKETENEKN